MIQRPNFAWWARDVRAADAFAIGRLGMPGYELMTCAAQSAYDELRRRWPAARRLCVLCGGGNNGGDGYVLARVARADGLEAQVVAAVDVARLKGDAARAAADFTASGGRFDAIADADLAGADVIVDALFGTGLDRPVEGPFHALIVAGNNAGRPIVALDLPSGLHADTGSILGIAIRADLTVSFVGAKAGFWLGDGPNVTGALYCDDLGVPGAAFEGRTAALRVIGDDLLCRVLPKRPRGAHKGDHGRVVIIGGGLGMPGAVRLAGEAALRVGAGLVTVLTHPAHATAFVAARPELMCHGVADAQAALPFIQTADVVAIGPGLGQDDWARELFQGVIARPGLRVLDADALNLLAQSAARADDWVLTPHPGEAARLLGTTTRAIQADRRGAVQAIAARYGGVAVLKGAGTLVASAEAPPWVCDAGNPGMATAGMGDVLTGVVAGILGQHCVPSEAAAASVLLHARAADRAACQGERGLLASDVINELRGLANP